LETDPLPKLGTIFLNIQFHPLTLTLGYCLIIVFILILFSALLSASEAAFFKISSSDKQKLEGKYSKKYRYIRRNLEAPEQMLATLWVANIFIKVSIVLIAGYNITNLIEFSEFPVWGFIVQIFILSFLLLFFCEFLPKVFATHHAMKIARFIAFPLFFLTRFLKPIIPNLKFYSNFIDNRIQAYSHQNSIDELSKALERTSQKEIKEDQDILKGIVKFRNKYVVEIMRSRVDVVSADISDNYAAILQLITETGFSRIPVYSESFDQIKGILYSKDLFPHVHKGPTFNWQSIIRPPFYVPETKKIDVLLEEFQKNKVHMAIVVDEYGATSGIVTLEDVLEEIVGEITDEFDEVEKYYTKIGENKLLLDVKTILSDFYTITGAEESLFEDVKGEADTLAGLILELKGEIPLKNDTILCKNYVFTIEAVDNRRIIQIKVETKNLEE